eukprot:GHVT01102253.1.p2 GENE.GHVT01102253.1~~GHVT01102253.1.p2  ORF type:complete len:105 (-),score=11.96 GHVT01102253.1:306-620(-)
MAWTSAREQSHQSPTRRAAGVDGGGGVRIQLTGSAARCRGNGRATASDRSGRCGASARRHKGLQGRSAEARGRQGNARIIRTTPSIKKWNAMVTFGNYETNTKA